MVSRIGPTPPFVCHLQCQHNRAQSDNNTWIPEFSRVICRDLADRNYHANIHRAGGNQIFRNNAAKHRIPSA